MNTDTTFFTNEDWQSLIDRFKVSLPNNTKFFDVLVWYFRSSWFFQLYDSLEKIEKIRILVWLNLDKKSFEIIETVKKWKTEIIENYCDSVSSEFENCEDNIDTEKWVRKFIEFISSNKLEIKIYPESIHSKLYIIRKDQDKDPEHYWKIITGSSNFSMAWLKTNIEFNVELKDKRDVEFALDKFEYLWKRSIEVTKDYIDTIKFKTWLNDDISPYDLYLKFLYEYFWDRVNEDKNILDNIFLPEWFKKLKYQEDAVKDALNKLKKYNWVFIADVVWLWKTYISALLWQQLSWWILIICPPHLKDYWEQTFLDFRVPCKVESIWKIEKIIDEWHDRFQYIFIDEAHRFRNDWTKSYEYLRQICVWKKIILVSATPFNNRFNDLYSLITLFQSGRNSTIPNIRNLEVFFKWLENYLKNIDKKENFEEYTDQLEENSNKIRERILKPLMIRRTRKEIEKYFSDDIKKQGLSFPKVEDPYKIMYKFDDNLDELFNWTIDALWKMSYARYTPAKYIKEEARNKVKQIEIIWQANLKWFMKTLIVKRLESSFDAFRNSINRMIWSYRKFIEMYKNWDIYVSKKVDVYDLLETDFNWLLEFVEKWDVIKYDKDDFRSDDEKDFEKDLYKDLWLLEKIYKKWSEIDYDPKLDELKLLISNDLKNKQVIIFSESKETVDYLKNNLESFYPWKILAYSSQSEDSLKDTIKRNYDPNNKKQENNIKILITTDVLAEWINLHKSNIIINYDIPWNPTRVLQRIWRINRVWTSHRNIYIYNFFPTVQSNNAIWLEENVKSKMDAFIKLLWTDAKYLTDSEEIEWHILFDKLNSIDFLTGEEWENIEKSELKYLEYIRKIRDTDLDLFNKIKKLPKKSRSWRKLNWYNKFLLTFFRKWDFLKIYFTDMFESRELSFEKAIDILECQKNESKQKIDISWYYELLLKNKNEFNMSLKEDESLEYTIKKWRSNESEVIWFLELIKNKPWLIEQEENFFINLLESIRSWNLPTKTLKEVKKNMKESFQFENTTILYNKLIKLIPNEFLNKSNWGIWVENRIEVILNEYII